MDYYSMNHTMMIWPLIACALISLTQGFSQADLKVAVLDKLKLKEPPRIQKRDLENLVVPTNIRNKYLSMLKLHHKRRRRSVPSLAGILKGIPGNEGISGEIVYSDATRERLVFDMDGRIPANSELTMAELKLFKTDPGRLTLAKSKSHRRPVKNARVSVYWVEILDNGSNRTSLVDSRLVPIHESGWQSFDVTQAVHYWSKGSGQSRLHLQLWVEGERPGRHAAEMARRVRFTMGPSGSSKGTPELLLFTLNLEEYGSRGDCASSKANMCCREEHFVNFRELSWTQFWIVEPAGYQAFRCAGGCKQTKRYYGYGDRRCVATESAPLPIMYLVKNGDHTEIEVAEFPNMIVEKCGCTMDNMLTLG